MSLPTLGNRLKAYRMRMGYSQTYVANMLMVSPSTVSKWETFNAIHMTLYKIIQITSLYHVSVFELLTHGWFKNIPIIEGGEIVVIDDQQTALVIYQRYLSSHLNKTNIITFLDPIRAKEYLFQKQVRLIITDHHMPGLNGGDLLTQINQHGANQHTPTILMTDKEEKTVIRKIAKQENAIFYDKALPKSVFITTITDILKIS